MEFSQNDNGNSVNSAKLTKSIEFFLNVFIEFAEFSDPKNAFKRLFKPATSCLRDQCVTTVPARNR